MKKGRRKEGKVGLRQKPLILSMRGGETENHHNHKYKITNKCQSSADFFVQNAFETVTFSKTQGSKQSKERWEWCVNDKRKTKAGD